MQSMTILRHALLIGTLLAPLTASATISAPVDKPEVSRRLETKGRKAPKPRPETRRPTSSASKAPKQKTTVCCNGCNACRKRAANKGMRVK